MSIEKELITLLKASKPKSSNNKAIKSYYDTIISTIPRGNETNTNYIKKD